jgi:hypothetical protein
MKNGISAFGKSGILFSILISLNTTHFHYIFNSMTLDEIPLFQALYGDVFNAHCLAIDGDDIRSLFCL